MKAAWRLAATLALVQLTGCGFLAPRDEAPRQLASQAGRSWHILAAGAFDLAAVPPTRPQPGGTLAVYLEGDGRAFVQGHPSTDPTPPDPEVLRMTLAHPGGFSAYLARPCQYTMPDHGQNCRSEYWSGSRYAPDVLESASQGLDWLKRESGADRLILVGYSGGGAMAALLAARRSDVAGIVTMAGDLALAYWTQRDGLTPLSGSLDPADATPRIAAIPQLHFIGGKDETVEPDVSKYFFSRLPAGSPARLITIPSYTHYCCWVEDWAKLARRPEFALIPGWPRP